ncbi:hypothetical protein PSN45_003069 [Yamadazyma tenuis]|uniref:Periplasmic binding protein-like II n=1 Tax=Candida tenuis (strain ATCC 10573 / BCRC 21748 / CBS 615 / JCM 9827 / NBRC 10315 / NRRL Y-1498 / VKM Y-70) TaxID=590646 RepID=G3AXA3_CANTC|nr:periplasmic binding protein-like II [Yamadazyma tenuis ATCC 10573]XP_006683988.1 uncharacterized protein CANTEDRAFT_112072 [Yamadazyma tenuis ATCC 10573]EGV66729.1 periplasmic binding protein-like II [Yamadazyma tenuis ATCC 10573]EGV66730.1 hypothetical protein CANTEDRAFT_112072 [Yamadazyma tenuis ATCC 10573]WEJ95549.1 hypothetical protein PSN45_003069 [Yamadazyma tenuis]
MPATLRVAYVPEHFSTPLFLAQEQGFYGNITIQFVPVIEGSGRLIKMLNTKEVDIAIGLTEAFISDIAKGNEEYKLIGTYVESPLCWAVSTGYDRSDITQLSDLQGKRIGVSRIGSGSYIMSFVLGLQEKFASPFFSDHPVLSNFKNLRDSVNLKFGSAGDGELSDSDAFMWEHFTSKKYYDTKEIKKIGEIYTPWPSWVVNCNSKLLEAEKPAIKQFLTGVRKGIEYFWAHQDEATTHIATHLDYSKADAEKWIETVKFNNSVGDEPINRKTVVDNTAKVLQTAGVLTDSDDVITQRLSQGVVFSL